MTGSHGRPKIFGYFKPVLASQQKLLRRQFGATLAATSGKNRATGTGLHTQTETVGLCAATGIWLKGTLAHEVLLQNIWWVNVKISSSK